VHQGQDRSIVVWFCKRQIGVASEAGVDCQACWLSYKDGLGFPIEEKDSKSNPLPAGLAVKRTSCRQ